MDTLQIAIAEADSLSAQRLYRYTADFGQVRGCQFSMERFSSAEELSVHYQPRFDLLLVCIEEPFAGAMAAVDRIRRQDEAVGIVLISDRPEYALYGYEVGALGYMLKPIDYPSFLQTMDHTVYRLRQETCLCLSIPTGEETVRLKSNRIGYVQYRDRELIVRTCTNNYTFPISIGQISPTLEAAGFCYCSETVLFNPTFVDRIEQNRVWIWGDSLTLSPSRAAEVMATLTINTIILEGGVEEEQTAALPNHSGMKRRNENVSNQHG